MSKRGRLAKKQERQQKKFGEKRRRKESSKYLKPGPKPKPVRAPAVTAEKPVEREPERPIAFHPFLTKPSSRPTEQRRGIAAPKRFEDMHPYDVALMLISTNPKFRDRADDPISLSVEIGRGKHTEAVQRLRGLLGEGESAKPPAARGAVRKGFENLSAGEKARLLMKHDSAFRNDDPSKLRDEVLKGEYSGTILMLRRRWERGEID